MTLYHASFKGRGVKEHFKPLRRVNVVLSADSIYDVEELIQEKYEFLSGMCVTDCEAIGRNIFEVKPHNERIYI